MRVVFLCSALILLSACGDKEQSSSPLPPAQTNGSQSAVVSDVTGNVNIQYKDERAASALADKKPDAQAPVINQVSGDATVQYVTNFYGANAADVKRLQDDLKLSQQAAETLLKRLSDKNVAVENRTGEFASLARKYADLQKSLGEVSSSDALSQQARAALQAGDLDKAENLLEQAYQRDKKQADKQLAQHSLLLAELSALKLENSKAVERYQETVRLQPDNLQAWMDLATLAGKLGDSTLALSAWRQLEQQTSADKQPEMHLDALIHQGRLLADTGDIKGALRYLHQAQQMANALVKKQSDNSNPAMALFNAYTLEGELLLERNDIKAALPVYQAAEGVAQEQLGLKSEDLFWQHQLSVAYTSLATVYRKLGNTAVALEWHRKAVDIATAIVEKEPWNTDHQYNLLYCYDHQGKTFEVVGDNVSALQVYQKTKDIASRLLKENPERTDWESALGIALSKMGSVSLHLNDYAAARDYQQEAIRIDEKLAGVDPDNVHWKNDVATDYSNLGDAYRFLKDSDLAINAYQRTIDIYQGLLVDDGEGAQYLNGLKSGFLGLAHAYQDVGAADKALSAANKGMEISKKLITMQPDNPDWQAEAATAYMTIGDIYYYSYTGKQKEAKASFAEANNLLAVSLAKNSRMVVWRRNYALNMQRLGDLEDEKKKRRILLGKSLELLEQLKSEGNLLTEQQANIDWAKEQLGLKSVGNKPTLAGVAGNASVQHITTVSDQVVEHKTENSSGNNELSGELKTEGDQSAIVTNIQGNVTIRYVTNFYGADGNAVKQLQDKLKLDKDQAEALLKTLADKNVELGQRTEEFNRLAQTYVDLQVQVGSYAATDELAQQAHKALQAGHLDVSETLLERIFERDKRLTNQQLAQRAFDLAQVSELKLDRKKAIERYQEVVSRQPDNIDAWQNMAKLAQASGNNTLALDAWGQLRKNVNPDVKPYAYITAMMGIGDIYRSQEELVKASGVYQLALSEIRKWHEKEPENREWQELLAPGLASLGMAQMLNHEQGEAGRNLEDAISIQTQLLEKMPGDKASKRHLSQYLKSLGDVQLLQKDFEAASKSLEKSLLVMNDLLASEPDNVEFKSDVFVRLSTLGDVLRRMGKTAEGMKKQKSALAILDELLAIDSGNIPWQQYKVLGLLSLADVYGQAGDSVNAGKSANQAVDTATALYKLDQKNIAWQRLLVNAYTTKSSVLTGMGSYNEAVESAEKALALLKGFLQKAATNFELNREHAIVLNTLAEAYAGMKNGKLEKQSYEHSRDVTSSLLVSFPDNTQLLADLVYVLDNLQRLYKEDSAQDYLIKTYQQLIPLQEKQLQAQYDKQKELGLYANYLALADACSLKNNAQGALDSYQAALALSRKILAAKTGDEQLLKAEVAINLNRVGSTYLLLNDKTKASEAFKEATPLLTALVQAKPEETSLQMALVINKYQTAQTLADKKHDPKHDILLHEAIVIVDKLREEKRLADDYKTWPEEMRSELNGQGG